MFVSETSGSGRQRVKYTVKYPRSVGPPVPSRRASIEMKMYHHDLLTVEYEGQLANWHETLASGAPISMSYKNSRREKSFVGYISHVRADREVGTVNATKIFGIQSSYDLRETGQHIWTNRTSSEIVTEVAKRFRLKPHVRQHELRYPNIAQNGRSYWQLLTDLAEESGYMLRIDGVDLYYVPLDTYIESKVTQAPTLIFKDRLTRNYFDARTVESFRPLTGDYTEGNISNERVAVAAIDPRTGQTGVYQAAPGGRSLRRRRLVAKNLRFDESVAHSLPEARTRAMGRAEQGRMNLTARAIVGGDPRIRPYFPVYVEAAKNPMSGWWLVKSATHQMESNGNYLVDCVLTTDGIGTSALPAPPSYSYRDLGLEVSTGLSLDNEDSDAYLVDGVETYDDGTLNTVRGLAGYGNSQSSSWVSV